MVVVRVVFIIVIITVSQVTVATVATVAMMTVMMIHHHGRGGYFAQLAHDPSSQRHQGVHAHDDIVSNNVGELAPVLYILILVVIDLLDVPVYRCFACVRVCGCCDREKYKSSQIKS